MQALIYFAVKKYGCTKWCFVIKNKKNNHK